jgi:DeoR family transcriptional regulator of aga operon
LNRTNYVAHHRPFRHNHYSHRAGLPSIAELDRHNQCHEYPAMLADSSVAVILTRGTLRKNSFSLIGPLAEESLRQLSADVLFLAVDGFDVTYGLTTPNQLEARVNRVMSESARRTIVVCDSSKLGRRSLSLIMPVSFVHKTVTNRGISKHDYKALREAEVTLV